jgi:hypothetical protein
MKLTTVIIDNTSQDAFEDPNLRSFLQDMFKGAIASVSQDMMQDQAPVGGVVEMREDYLELSEEGLTEDQIVERVRKYNAQCTKLNGFFNQSADKFGYEAGDVVHFDISGPHGDQRFSISLGYKSPFSIDSN